MATKTEVLLGEEASVTEMDELRPLIAEGQERGHLTIERITSFLEEVEITKEQVLELHSVMDEQGIEILGSDGQPLKSDGRLSQDSTDTDRRLFLHAKSNIAEPALGLAFTLVLTGV